MRNFFRNVASIAASLRVIADALRHRQLVKEEADWLWGDDAKPPPRSEPPQVFDYSPERHAALERRDEELNR